MQIYSNNLINKSFDIDKTKNVFESKNTNKEYKKKSFYNILEKQEKTLNSQIQFSKHATMRLDNRNLFLNNSQIKRVEQGVFKAQQKGIKDTLVLVDNIALVVNVKNKIVITAVDNNEKIYTNIDGAVIV